MRKIRLLAIISFLAFIQHMLIEQEFMPPALAADRVTCTLEPTTYQSLSSDVGHGDIRVVTKAVSSILEKRLSKSGKFEVETRDRSKLPPGAKFKAARFAVICQLTVFPNGTTGHRLVLDGKVVNFSDGGTAAAAEGSSTVNGAMTWPGRESDYSANEFKNSDLGKALTETIDTLVLALDSKADSIISFKEIRPLSKTSP